MDMVEKWGNLSIVYHLYPSLAECPTLSAKELPTTQGALLV
jgi:hypothetical protein